MLYLEVDSLLLLYTSMLPLVYELFLSKEDIVNTLKIIFIYILYISVYIYTSTHIYLNVL